MPELRKDYVTDTWVVFAPDRARRPFDTEGAVSLSSSREDCPFCPGHEHMTPPEVLAYPVKPSDGSSWRVRCVPNKFPALTPEGAVTAQDDGLFHSLEGVGAHEIIVETPDHTTDFAALTTRQIQDVLRAYAARAKELAKDPRLAYVLIFKNHGAEAGASLYHAHSQLIAMPMVPRRIQDELRGAANHHSENGTCVYDGILAEELNASERIAFANDDFVALCPYASRFPFEIWVLPRRHRSRFEKTTASERRSLAELLRVTVRGLDTLFGNPPFNWYIHTAPSDEEEYTYYHWHLELTPRLSRKAGFERGTGFYINSVPPEDAAWLLRRAMET